MSNQRSIERQNWGNHPLVVLVTILAGLIAFFVFVIGLRISRESAVKRQRKRRPTPSADVAQHEASADSPAAPPENAGSPSEASASQSSPPPSGGASSEMQPTHETPTSTPSIAEQITTAPQETEPVLPPKTPPFTIQKWEGEFTQYDYGKYSMILSIEEVKGSLFKGRLRWPTLGNSITSISGELMTDLGDAVEQSKWLYIKDFKLSADGIRIRFVETKLLQGDNIILNNRYYAYIRDDKSMVGVYFRNDRESKPGGDFIVTSSM